MKTSDSTPAIADLIAHMKAMAEILLEANKLQADLLHLCHSQRQINAEIIGLIAAVCPEEYRAKVKALETRSLVGIEQDEAMITDLHALLQALPPSLEVGENGPRRRR